MFPIPGMTIPMSLTGGAGGASGPAGGGSTGLADNFNTPFNFDNSGWITNLGTTGTTSTASGNTGANQAAQTATPTAIAPTTGNQISALMGGGMLPIMMAGAALIMVLMRK